MIILFMLAISWIDFDFEKSIQESGKDKERIEVQLKLNVIKLLFNV